MKNSSNMVYIALWIFPDYRRIPWELKTPSNRGGVTQNSIVDGVMGKFAILRVGFSYPFLPTLSSYPYRNNFFGRPRRRGRLWHVTATVIGSVSVQELNGRPLAEYRAQSGRLSGNGFGRERTCGRGASGRVPINYVGLGRIDGGSWGLWVSGNTGSMVRVSTVTP
ncbi:hypothetical protein J6590_090944 [Homalodisca vitripennis]|nr:hypothetical protein J6590_090944 [Homalodisca vitripennis]